MASLVQDSGMLGGSSGTAVTSLTFNAASNFTVGNKVIVCVSFNSGGATISSATIAGTTANKDASRETDAFRSCYIFSVDVVNAGSTAVVFNFSASSTVTGIVLNIQEWSGLGAVDQTANALGTGTTNQTITSGTTTQADELVFAVLTTTGNPGATTLPSGYTTLYDNLDANPYTVYGSAVYKTVSATGTQTATWTLTNATNGRLAIATYKIAEMGITIGAATYKQQAASTTATTTAATTQTSGSTFLIGRVGEGSPGTQSDNKGNSYTQLTPVALAFGGAALSYKVNGAGGASHTFTDTTGSNINRTVFALELIGVGALDTTAFSDDPSSPFTCSITPTAGQRRIIAFFGGDSGSNPATHAESSGFTIISATDSTDGSTGWTGCFAYRDVTTNGSTAYTASFTESGGTEAGVFLLSFSLPDSGPSAGIKMRMFSNGAVQVANLVEIAGAQNKLYANGTYVTSKFIEA